MEAFKLIVTLILVTFNSYSQKITTYNYGQDGMEIVMKSEECTFIYSNFNAIIGIRTEVGIEIMKQYSYKPSSSKLIEVKMKDYTVSGRLVIIMKDNLISLNFYYTKVKWKNGDIDLYIKPK